MKRTGKLSSDYRLTIPKLVREEMRWTKGQKLAFLSKSGGVLLVPIPSRDDLVGIAKAASRIDYRERD